MKFFATCPKHVEQLLAVELAGFGATELKHTTAGVHFSGELSLAYRVCLWSRLANRVLLPIACFDASTGDALYEGARSIDWLEHLLPDGSLAVDCAGRTPGVTHTKYGALRVKDAVVDICREREGVRPDVDLELPDVRINVHLRGTEATISIDLSGGSLHRRGYRKQGGPAPLKENLAAAILIRAGWPALAAQGAPLVDPMCGSGTLLIEGACIAADIAPGLLRDNAAGSGWLGHHPLQRTALLEEACARREAGLAGPSPWIRGFEANPKGVATARRNIDAAGLSEWVKIKQSELAHFAPQSGRGGTGLVVCNPPYGERLGEVEELVYLYRGLGQRLKEACQGWQAALFTGNPELGKTMGLRAHKVYQFFNGALPCQLLMFEVDEKRFVKSSEPSASAPAQVADAPLGSGAEMFANRLKKNLKRLGKWARKQGLECYRLYDQDMPEYAVAIDRYGEWVHVQEYAAPSTIDPEKAAARLKEALQVIPQVLGIPSEKLVLKVRERQRGRHQYARKAHTDSYLEVREDDCRLLVNLTDFLDTGLFLDHRLLRRRIGEEAAGKRFLNLYCYTASATVHAAKGGATATTSVDTSPTYLAWARRNLSLNGLSAAHLLKQQDCRTFLAEDSGKYELIFLDPPTFSNTKRADQQSLDLQRDHVGLITSAAARLTPGGTLYFSTNYRRFKIDEAGLAGLSVTDITAKTIDQDFSRSPRIHYCWRIQQASP